VVADQCNPWYYNGLPIASIAGLSTSRFLTKKMVTLCSSILCDSDTNDPKLDKNGDVTTPVEVGNTLTVLLEYVDRVPLETRWLQSMKKKMDLYYQAMFTSTSKGESLG
jgi:hypothetical protein